MKYLTTRVGAIGATLATTGILGVGGVAAACPEGTQTSNYNNGSANASYGDSGWSNTGYRMSDSNRWDPSMYMSNHQGDYDDWPSGAMNNNWMPSDSNWQ
jgi:hypothetical protein